MRKFIVAGLLAATVTAASVVPARAGVFIRVPFVTVVVDRGVHVGAGPVRVDVPGQPAVRTPSALPGVVVSEQTPAVRGEEQLPSPTPLPAVVKPFTVEQFAEAFKPQPGKYEVVLIHPKSGCPVKVCFELPAGCPRKVRWTKHVLEFDYGRDSVRIRFYHDGDVKVIY
jgi:hypothetical protein